jgi:hypothetical protein
MPMTGAGSHIEIGAQAIGVVTRASPAIAGRTLTEGYLTHPALMVDAALFGDALALKATLNFEGATLKRGELDAGIYGEGYVDRRHPHTYLHELVLTGTRAVGAARASASIGKGFVPFGTDDPMSRPFEKYPINHHLAQILERVVAIGAIRARSVALEGSLFDGDEPEGPGDVPNRARYWDSWAGRATFTPFPQTEFQASYARVRSPENARGGGADQHKSSASVRLEDAQHTGYALLEWASTGTYAGAQRNFTFNSILAESAASYGIVRGAVRFERTDRPDEQRLADAFRAPVPASDLSIAGRSRWNVLTVRASLPVSLKKSGIIEPFVEVARSSVAETLKPSGFDPVQFYGSNHLWSMSAGARLSIGMPHMRMGRYGVAISPGEGMSMPHTMQMERMTTPTR